MLVIARGLRKVALTLGLMLALITQPSHGAALDPSLAALLPGIMSTTDVAIMHADSNNPEPLDTYGLVADLRAGNSYFTQLLLTLPTTVASPGGCIPSPVWHVVFFAGPEKRLAWLSLNERGDCVTIMAALRRDVIGETFTLRGTLGQLLHKLEKRSHFLTWN